MLICSRQLSKMGILGGCNSTKVGCCHTFMRTMSVMLPVYLGLIIALAEQKTEAKSFSDQLETLLKGKSRHLEKIQQMDPITVERKRRDVPEIDDDYDGDYRRAEADDTYMENCRRNSFEEIYRESYKGPVCDIIDARNTIDSLKDLENCTIVNGYVNIVFMHDLKPSDLKKYRFPKLRVITHHLLVFRIFGLKTLRYMFPNLAVIGGRGTIAGYSLILFENPNMVEIGLKSLQFIKRGSVRIQKNPALCYLSTVDWERLGSYSNKDIMSKFFLGDNRDYDTCVDQCGEETDCSDKNEEFCWGLGACQKKSCPIECPDACDHNLTCSCHPECLAGCTQPNDPTACTACKHKYYNETCISECPPGTYLMHGWRCVEMEYCRKFEWYFLDDNKCVKSCPPGYQVNVTDCKLICTKCQDDCGIVCEDDITIQDVESLRSVEVCRKISGALILGDKMTTDVIPKLEDSLKDVESIGSLIVKRAHLLINLSFLNNLKTITGVNKEQDEYSVYVLENKNLKELWNMTETKLKILGGKAFFHFNPQLCKTEVKMVENLTPEIEDVTDVSNMTNGDKATCHFQNIHLYEPEIYPKKPFAVIAWDSFVVKDQRTLIGYQVHYKESPEKNAQKSDGIVGCLESSWTIREKQKDPEVRRYGDITKFVLNNDTDAFLDEREEEQSSRVSLLLSGLRPFTQYAYYVKAYTTSDAGKGAASDIAYFKTNPAPPSQPQKLHATGKNSTSLNITWEIPAEPNGIMSHYIIEWQQQTEEDVSTARQVDSCKLSSRRPPPTTTSKPEKPVKQEQTDEKCDCKSDEEKKRLQDQDGAAKESAAFENFLQDNIFLALNYDELDSGVESDYYAVSNESYSRKKRSLFRRSLRDLNSSDSEVSIATTMIPEITTNSEMENASVPLSFPKRRLVVTDNFATLTGLHHFSEYSIQVYACNHAADPGSKTDPNYKVKEKPFYLLEMEDDPDNKYVKCSIEALMMKRTASNVTADSIPGNIWFEKIEDDKGLLNWRMPTDPNAYIKNFRISISKQDEENDDLDEELCISVNETADKNGFATYPIAAPKTVLSGSYSVKVMPVSLAGDGVWSEPISFSLIDINMEQNSSHIAIIVGVLIFFSLVIIALIVVYYYRERQKAKFFESAYFDINPDYSTFVYNVDEYEVDIDDVRIEREIGQGCFGLVFEGIARGVVKGQVETRVAIKTLHENAMPGIRAEFLKEANIMKAFNAYHVVRLLGVVSKTANPMLILEYMERGDLRTYLKSRRRDPESEDYYVPLTNQEKLQMAAEIADGMAYLSSDKFVHRDLAARNCLVNEQGTVKIGDFGLARDIYETDYYRKESRGFLPIRWMAPEALKDGIFNTTTDVWSYGIVLWEISSLGQQPYQGKSHDEVTRLVIDGGYLERPKRCPNKLYDIMTLCWQYNPHNRPNFLEIIQELYDDVNDSFKEVCFFGRVKSDQIESEMRPYTSQNHTSASISDHFSEPLLEGRSPRQHKAKDNVYVEHNSLSRAGSVHLTPILPKNDRNLSQSVKDNRDTGSLNTASTSTSTTPSTVIRKPHSHKNGGSSHVNEYDESSNHKEPCARDSGAFMNQPSQYSDRDPLVEYKDMNGGVNKSHDTDLDLESGLDEGMWNNSTSQSSISTPTETHELLSPDQKLNILMAMHAAPSSC